jgi:hypothetical protein
VGLRRGCWCGGRRACIVGPIRDGFEIESTKHRQPQAATTSKTTTQHTNRSNPKHPILYWPLLPLRVLSSWGHRRCCPTAATAANDAATRDEPEVPTYLSRSGRPAHTPQQTNRRFKPTHPKAGRAFGPLRRSPHEEAIAGASGAELPSCGDCKSPTTTHIPTTRTHPTHPARSLILS